MIKFKTTIKISLICLKIKDQIILSILNKNQDMINMKYYFGLTMRGQNASCLNKKEMTKFHI